MTEQKLNVEGMNCGHCVSSVRKLLEALPGITSVQVSLEAKQASITIDHPATEAVLLKVFSGSGFTVSLAPESSSNKQPIFAEQNLEEKKKT